VADDVKGAIREAHAAVDRLVGFHKGRVLAAERLDAAKVAINRLVALVRVEQAEKIWHMMNSIDEHEELQRLRAEAARLAGQDGA
jgi:hypothetical protein